MLPIGPLMIEHRLIERMVALIAKERRALEESGKVRLDFIEAVVDFYKTYADLCHHGKEEDILFAGLAKKPLSGEHRRMMEGLLADHVWGREIVARIVAVREEHAGGKKEARPALAAAFKEIVELYTDHIDKEDNRFFLPSMDYFTKEEQDAMLEAFREFDRKIIPEKYEKLLERFENP